MSDIVCAPTTEGVVRSLNIISAHILCFRTDGLRGQIFLAGLSGLATTVNQIETATGHVQGKLHVVVDSIVDGLDAVRVVDSKLGVVRCLNVLVDDTVSNTQSVEVELDTRNGSVGDELVLVVEVVEERRSVVPL